MTVLDNIKANNWPSASNSVDDFTIAKVYWDEPNAYLATKVGSTVLHDNTPTMIGGISPSGSAASTNNFNIGAFATFTGSSTTMVSFDQYFMLPTNGDFTVDMYMKKTTTTWGALFGNWSGAQRAAQVSLGINGSSSANWDYYFAIENGSNDTWQNSAQSTTWDATAWCHYRHEYVKSTRAFRSWTNGTLTGSVTVTSPGIRYSGVTNLLDIGHQGDNSNATGGDWGPMRIVAKALGAPPSGGLVLNPRGRFETD